MVCIGKILKSQGIKGEVKASLFLDNPKDFSRVPYVFLGEEKFHVAAFRYHQGFLYLQFDEVTDRNEADRLRGKSVFIEDRFKPKLPKNRFYVGDLIGCRIVTGEGSVVGEITDINNYGSADVVSFSGERGGMFPYLNVVVLNVDVEGKTMVVDGVELEKVCVYED